MNLQTLRLGYRVYTGRAGYVLKGDCATDLDNPSKHTEYYAFSTTLTNRAAPISMAFISVHMANYS